MKSNIGRIIVFFIDSYIGMAVSIAVFCISLIVLIVKRKTLKVIARAICVSLTITCFALVCLSIYFSAAFGKYNQLAASNIVWTLDNDKITSGNIKGKLIKNNIVYKDVAMTVLFENNNFIFEIYDHKQNVFVNNAAYQIDYGAIKYEKGIDQKNNTLVIEDEIFTPFLLEDKIFTVSFFDMVDDELGNYVFALKGNNFLEIWPQMSGKQYEHLPVWETE